MTKKIVLHRIYTKQDKEVLRRMAAGDTDIEAWLKDVKLQQTHSGYWLAWHDALNPPWQRERTKKLIERVAVLEPRHEEGRRCEWLESCDGKPDISPFIEYIENGTYAKEEPICLNLFIVEVRDKDGNRIPELEDKPGFMGSRFIDADD